MNGNDAFRAAIRDVVVEVIQEIAKEEAKPSPLTYVPEHQYLPIARCPACGANIVEIQRRSVRSGAEGKRIITAYWANCFGCYMKGPRGDSVQDARQKWNDLAALVELGRDREDAVKPADSDEREV